MYQGRIVFSQLLDFLSRKRFRTCVNRYDGNYRIRSLTCYEQFLCMAFALLEIFQGTRYRSHPDLRRSAVRVRACVGQGAPEGVT